uniref:TFIIS N-terminal domain-containing protein n=1 Tax=Lactuca sativa TaxID=4236 RepID=A0A9R1W8U7_LACSA|nr:hypothetical protein LSAT_V11C300142440 [Lactuca sativa]
MSPECAPSSQKLSRYLSTDDLRIQVIFTTRKQAFNDAQTMTFADRGRALPIAFIFTVVGSSANRQPLLAALRRRQFSDSVDDYAKRNYANNVSEYNTVIGSLTSQRRLKEPCNTGTSTNLVIMAHTRCCTFIMLANWRLGLVLREDKTRENLEFKLRSLVSKQVGPTEQGKAQGCITCICSFPSIVSPLIFNPLTVVAEEDAKLNRQSKPAINKLKKLPLLTKFPIHLDQYDRKEQLKKSGLGKATMFLSKSDEETTSNRKLAKDLVDKGKVSSFLGHSLFYWRWVYFPFAALRACHLLTW